MSERRDQRAQRAVGGDAAAGAPSTPLDRVVTAAGRLRLPTQFPFFLVAALDGTQRARQRLVRRRRELLLGRRAEPEAARQRLDALGTPEMGALRLEDGDVAARLLDGALLLGDARLELPGVVVDAVEDERAGDREDQGRQDDDPHRAPPARSAAASSPTDGTPSSSSSSGQAGASVRTAARSRADLARGFTSSSPFEGVNGRELTISETRCLQILSIAPAGAASRATSLPARSAKNRFTMRSSSEWKVTTTSRPPGFRLRSAAASAAGQLAQLVVHVDAQRLEGPRRRMLRIAARVRRRARETSSASARVVVMGPSSARALTIARAMARERRSSPSM